MYRVFQVFKRDFLNLAFNPMWIFYNMGYPILLILILGFLSSGSFGRGVTSYDYYGVSMMIYTALNTSMIASNSFLEERVKKPNTRLIYSPIPNSVIYISKIAAAFVFSCLCHLVVIVFLQQAFGVNFGGKHFWWVMLMFLVLEAFASILGVLLCCIFSNENIANQLLSIVVTTFAVLGGIFFRVDGYGKALQLISKFSPLKWIDTGIFKIIYDGDFSNYSLTIIMILGLSMLLLFLCRVFYRTEDYI